MRHLATISEGRFERNPVHIECSCGVAGDFPNADDARQWMTFHFAKLTGLAYGEFAPASPTTSEPTPETESAPEVKKNEAENEAPLQNETVGDA